MSSQPDIIELREHADCIIEDSCLKQYLQEHSAMFEGLPEDYMGSPKHLGLCSWTEDDVCRLQAAYYIGASWLTKEHSVAILPKMDNIDFIGMFVGALEIDSSAEEDYFAKCYGISFDEPLISVPEKLNQLSPLLVVHYIKLLEKLVGSGLRKDYVTVEENLKSKIKGHLMFAPHLRKNILAKREDRAYCRYQVYTEDIPVNRLLKKALLFAQQMLVGIGSLTGADKLQQRLNVLQARFSEISDNVSISEVRSMSDNKLFRHYKPAVDVAKSILRRYGYSIADVSNEEMQRLTPPFWIDMPRLFEMYVYSQIKALYKGELLFQVPGHYQVADYIYIPENYDPANTDDRPLVIDAKYKPQYKDGIPNIVPDIREISGNARDVKILKAFGLGLEKEEREVACLIIYPTKAFEGVENRTELSADEREDYKDHGLNGKEPLWKSSAKLKQFRNFGKLNIALPTIK